MPTEWLLYHQAGHFHTEDDLREMQRDPLGWLERSRDVTHGDVADEDWLTTLASTLLTAPWKLVFRGEVYEIQRPVSITARECRTGGSGHLPAMLTVTCWSQDVYARDQVVIVRVREGDFLLNKRRGTRRISVMPGVYFELQTPG